MSRIGFSTGCLYKSNVEFSERIKLYFSLGANAIELSFNSLTELENLRLSKEFINDIKKYNYISIHAPCRDLRYGDNDTTKEVIGKLRSLCEKLSIKNIVLHPDVVDDFSVLGESNLPFAVENMDKRKRFGTKLEDFIKLKEGYNFGFVFDIQHSYEHDPSMSLAKDILFVMGDRLKHIHVSGANKTYTHLPLYAADNKNSIIKILNLKLEVPKILEGILFGNIAKTISEELAFIRSCEKRSNCDNKNVL